MSIHHPIRDVAIWSYVGKHGAIATFEDGSVFPIHTRGATEGEAIAKLETFRAGILDKHEAGFIARREAAAKAAKTRAAKVAA
jgi:hypothetical protein